MSSSTTPVPSTAAPTSVDSTTVRITIPSETLTSQLLETEPFLVTPNPTPVDDLATPIAVATATVPPKMQRCGTVEKVGRWSDEEHIVFVEGLTTYGRQWKTIAGMIGTRSVVQVRTHAQKYFQKLDRKNQSIHVPKLKSTTSSSSQGGASSGISRSHHQPKRKSLPSSMPSRKTKARKPNSRHMSLALGTSLPDTSSEFTTSDPLRGTSPTPVELSSHPSYISKSSGSISDGENWSTVSPYGVMDLVDLQVDSAALAAVDDDTANPAFDMMGDDPLEWLIETDNDQYLPESSLPLFPDLTEDAVVGAGASLSPPNVPEDVVDTAVQHKMVDPNVTVQTLLL